MKNVLHVLAALLLVVPALSLLALTPASAQPSEPPSPCAAFPSPQPAISHVIVIQMENQSYAPYGKGTGVIGDTTDAPFQNWLAGVCGNATESYGLTHSSAANYIGQASGETYLQLQNAADNGCGSVSGCADTSDNIFHQLTQKGDSWQAFMEGAVTSQGTPIDCDPTTSSTYKIGHNPVLFFQESVGGDIPDSDCQDYDIGVADLTSASAASNPFYAELQNQTLPSYTWISPNKQNSGDGTTSSLSAADTWLSKVVPLITGSPAYEADNTLLLITYDEGAGYSDYALDENCAPSTQPAPGAQESCHIPLFVVYPFADSLCQQFPCQDWDSTYFTHYSVLKTVEQIFKLSDLGSAGSSSTTSLTGHFGIPSS